MTLQQIEESITLLAVAASILTISYAGLMLITNKDPLARNQWKEVILGALVGLSLVFLAPLLSGVFTGGTYCR